MFALAYLVREPSRYKNKGEILKEKINKIKKLHILSCSLEQHTIGNEIEISIMIIKCQHVPLDMPFSII